MSSRTKPAKLAPSTIQYIPLHYILDANEVKEVQDAIESRVSFGDSAALTLMDMDSFETAGFHADGVKHGNNPKAGASALRKLNAAVAKGITHFAL